MNFDWTREQLEFKDNAVAFAERELNEGVVERDRLGEFSRENWNKCANFGILALSVPAAYGGREDTDFLTTLLANPKPWKSPKLNTTIQM